jgi:hypothetical protein
VLGEGSEMSESSSIPAHHAGCAGIDELPMQEVALVELGLCLVDVLDLLIVRSHTGHKDLDCLVRVQVTVGVCIRDFREGLVG